MKMTNKISGGPAGKKTVNFYNANNELMPKLVLEFEDSIEFNMPEGAHYFQVEQGLNVTNFTPFSSSSLSGS